MQNFHSFFKRQWCQKIELDSAKNNITFPFSQHQKGQIPGPILCLHAPLKSMCNSIFLEIFKNLSLIKDLVKIRTFNL